MTIEQITAVKCAYLDLKGSLEALYNRDFDSHDWDAHEESIEDIELAFPFLMEPKVQQHVKS